MRVFQCFGVPAEVKGGRAHVCSAVCRRRASRAADLHSRLCFCTSVAPSWRRYETTSSDDSSSEDSSSSGSDEEEEDEEEGYGGKEEHQKVEGRSTREEFQLEGAEDVDKKDDEESSEKQETRERRVTMKS